MSSSTQTPRQFPVHLGHVKRDDVYDGPKWVPWSLLMPHERQARANHAQDLETLARRGGLGPAEMVAVLEDRAWHGMSLQAAGKRLVEIMGGFVLRWIWKRNPEERVRVRVEIVPLENGIKKQPQHAGDMYLRENEWQLLMSRGAPSRFGAVALEIVEDAG